MDSPRAAVEATLSLIGDALAGDGFTLAPGLIIRRRDGDATDLLRTQSSVWNRSDTQARFEMSAWFESAAVGALRKKLSPGRPASVTKFDRMVNVRQLKFPGTPHRAQWDVIEPSVRAPVAGEAAAIIRADLLPWFDRMRDPVLALDELLTESIHASLLYAVATGNADAARARVAALAASNAAFGQSLERLRLEGKPRAFRGIHEPVAWMAIDLGLA